MCQTIGCNKETKGNTKFCTNCRQRKWRTNNPFKYHWKNLKNRASQRMIPFSLTLDEFKQIWEKHPEKWKERINDPAKSRWTLDRIDREKGYHFDNLQVMTRSDNSKKYHKTINEPKKEIPDAPF